MVLEGWKEMLDHARPFLDSARENAAKGPERAVVAFDEARHAAELAAKAILLRAEHVIVEKDHRMGRHLGRYGLMPSTYAIKAWNRFFAEHTKAAYGLYEQLDQQEIAEAISMAQTMLQACEFYPDFAFHPPRTV